MRVPLRYGYTLVETIVALLLFSVGGLALTSSAALIGRQLNVDGVRERAGLVVANRMEMLRAGCATATGGSESLERVESEWAVTAAAVGVMTVTATVSYASWNGRHSATYHALVPCR